MHVQLGEEDEARRLADEEVDLARGYGAPRCLGVALRAAGLVRTGPERIALLREAVGVLAASAGLLEHARALIDLGAALRRGGDRTEAREVLRAGQDLAARCEAKRLVDLAYEELLASGARPRRTATSGAESLTPSERRVADMAAQGLHEPRHRAGAVRHREDGRDAPRARVREARAHVAAAARGRNRRRRRLTSSNVIRVSAGGTVAGRLSVTRKSWFHASA